MKANSFLIIALSSMGASISISHAALPYTIVDTRQAKCYDTRSEIPPPKPGQPFYGQDAQYQGPRPDYVISSDSLTVEDRCTGLTWQRSPETNGDGALTREDKLTWPQAQAQAAKLNAAKFGGFNDWRLPSIKELYSLFDGRGTDPGGNTAGDTSSLIPFIDTKFFTFVYGNPALGERTIDSQYASSTLDITKSARGYDKLFGVNFADGRIKGYDLQMPGGNAQKKFFVICVRGNPSYGKNDFHDNGDGTITDKATGLTWEKKDSGKPMDWQQALAWAHKQNSAKYLGHDDWRVPDVKELQSIVDYSRSPDITHTPAIDPMFECTQFTNEGGKPDYGYYWSSTSHGSTLRSGDADYVAFGRAAGWMSARALAGGPPTQQGRPGAGAAGPGAGGPGSTQPNTAEGDYKFVDVHGAGAQRSDPKDGDPKMFPHGHGPQGDAIRIHNYVRLVRGGNVTLGPAPAFDMPVSAATPAVPQPSAPTAPGGAMPSGAPGGPGTMASPVVSALDLNGDGVIDSEELAKAPETLKKLDKNHDGKLTSDEYRPQMPGGRGGMPGGAGPGQGQPGQHPGAP